MKKKKVLIIRFSSFGDILQGFGIPKLIKDQDPHAELYWITKKEFAPMVALHPQIDHVISYDKKLGLLGLIQLSINLRSEKFSHIYDAHNNVRSLFMRLILKCHWNTRIVPKILVREKNRWKRFLLFKFGINHFPKPFIGKLSYEQPLEKWGIHHDLPNENDFITLKYEHSCLEKIQKLTESIHRPFITLVPSAAWELKKWPLPYFEKVIEYYKHQFDFVVLGGPDDFFLDQLAQKFPECVRNFRGQFNLIESMAMVKASSFIIANDTGLLHGADVQGVPGISLIGPSAFGYTYSKKIKTLEIVLYCKPCSKDGSGKCSHREYKKCMYDIRPEWVIHWVREHFSSSPKVGGS